MNVGDRIAGEKKRRKTEAEVNGQHQARLDKEWITGRRRATPATWRRVIRNIDPHIRVRKDADSEHYKTPTTHELLSHARMVRVINRDPGLSHSGNVLHLCKKDNVIITQCNKKSTTSLTFQLCKPTMKYTYTLMMPSQ